LPDYENIKIKDEQMLVTDYEEKNEGENEAETSENTEVENEETKE
jgi:hypothetical protein